MERPTQSKIQEYKKIAEHNTGKMITADWYMYWSHYWPFAFSYAAKCIVDAGGVFNNDIAFCPVKLESASELQLTEL